MKCKDIMTESPACCDLNDTVDEAAKLMQRENVGPIPVVQSKTDKKLAGMVTDRDLAIKVIAAGRDPKHTRLSEIMSRNLITCRPDDDLDCALRMMSENQVRRLPIMAESGRLLGIISQADLARQMDERHVGAVVEDISQPNQPATSRLSSLGASSSERAPNFRSIASGFMIGGLSLCAGAAAMYIMDPQRGRTRRAKARDKAIHYLHETEELVEKAGRDLRNRAIGSFCEMKSLLRHEDVNDIKLVQRIRSRLGRLVSHPHAVVVSASEGHVTLEGPILSHELSRTVNCISRMEGVTHLENRLEPHSRNDAHPALQGGRERRGELPEILQSNWTPSLRVGATLIGGTLALYGLLSRSRTGKLASTVGAGLMARAITNHEIASAGSLVHR